MEGIVPADDSSDDPERFVVNIGDCAASVRYQATSALGLSCPWWEAAGLEVRTHLCAPEARMYWEVQGNSQGEVKHRSSPRSSALCSRSKLRLQVVFAIGQHPPDLFAGHENLAECCIQHCEGPCTQSSVVSCEAFRRADNGCDEEA